jgi:hypothetical protein
MRDRLMAAAGGMLLMLAAACAPTYQVHTMLSPDAKLGGLHAFRVLPVPPARDRAERAGAYGPMVDNSIVNRALRATVTEGFEKRGYSVDEGRADFVVAVYASAFEALDVATWDYGYPYWPRYPGGVRRPDQATTYTAGTVVVDVLRPGTRELLWRGTGTARMTEDVGKDTKELQKVAAAIAKRFPRASERMVAGNR